VSSERRRIERARRGGYALRLPTEERELLRALPSQLRAVLRTDDPVLYRLFPPAYDDDPGRNAEFGQLVRGELLEGKLAALRVVEETSDAEHLDEAQLEAWLGALESFRLVLGTQLGVTEDTIADEVAPDDSRAPGLALYGYLSWLQEQAVEALAQGLPEAEEDG